MAIGVMVETMQQMPYHTSEKDLVKANQHLPLVLHHSRPILKQADVLCGGHEGLLPKKETVHVKETKLCSTGCALRLFTQIKLFFNIRVCCSNGGVATASLCRILDVVFCIPCPWGYIVAYGIKATDCQKLFE